jgi:hypothetical protein
VLPIVQRSQLVRREPIRSRCMRSITVAVSAVPQHSPSVVLLFETSGAGHTSLTPQVRYDPPFCARHNTLIRSSSLGVTMCPYGKGCCRWLRRLNRPFVPLARVTRMREFVKPVMIPSCTGKSYPARGPLNTLVPTIAQAASAMPNNLLRTERWWLGRPHAGGQHT